MGRLRNIGRLRAGGAGGFSPLSAFAASKKGLWLDHSDISSGFQDSAGATPLTASGQFVGKRNDKSGRANHVLQAGASARPEFDIISGISSDFTDGTDDGYSTAAFVAGTLTSAMDCFIAIKRAGTGQQVIMSDVPTGTKALGVIRSGGAGVTVGGAGAAWTCFVNGVQVGGTANTTEAQLFTALTLGAYTVLEFRDLDLSAWTQFTLGLYTAFMLNADTAQLVLCESQPALRSSLRTYCGAKAGLSL